MLATYHVPAANLASLQAKLEKLNKRAAKLGLQPITLTLGEETARWVRDETAIGGQRGYAVVACTVSGETPRLNGRKYAEAQLRDNGSHMWVHAHDANV